MKLVFFNGLEGDSQAWKFRRRKRNASAAKCIELIFVAHFYPAHLAFYLSTDLDVILFQAVPEAALTDF